MTFLAFHEDEAKAQALAGHQRPGRAAIRPFMPDQHREFFALLPYLFVATPDADGWPMASVLTGEPGFVQSPDPATLGIGALPASDDPATPTFVAGAEIGLLGLDFTTRRRNRANGRLVAGRSTGSPSRSPRASAIARSTSRRARQRPAPRPARRSSGSIVSTMPPAP